jgi:hypothetical protein
MGDGAELRAGRTYLDDLLVALQHLNRLLEQAMSAASAAYGPEAVEAYLRMCECEPEGQKSEEPALTGMKHTWS